MRGGVCINVILNLVCANASDSPTYLLFVFLQIILPLLRSLKPEAGDQWDWNSHGSEAWGKKNHSVSHRLAEACSEQRPGGGDGDSGQAKNRRVILSPFPLLSTLP